MRLIVKALQGPRRAGAKMPRVMATLVGSGRALALLAAVILLEPPLAR